MAAMASSDSPVPATCEGCGQVSAAPTTISDPGSLTTLTDEQVGTCDTCGAALTVQRGVYRSTPGGGLARRFG